MFKRMRTRYWETRLAWQLLSLRIREQLVRNFRAAMGLPRKRISLHTMCTVRHRDAEGNLLWADFGHNIFHDEGEEWTIKVLFTEEDTVPAAFYFGLDNRSSLAEADTLASLSGEPPGTYGYARIAVNSDATDFTASQEGGDWQAKTKTVTFTASGGSIGPVTKMWLCDVASGTAGDLIVSRALSQERTLANGESLDCNLYIRLSE